MDRARSRGLNHLTLNRDLGDLDSDSDSQKSALAAAIDSFLQFGAGNELRHFLVDCGRFSPCANLRKRFRSRPASLCFPSSTSTQRCRAQNSEHCSPGPWKSLRLSRSCQLTRPCSCVLPPSVFPIHLSVLAMTLRFISQGIGRVKRLFRIAQSRNARLTRHSDNPVIEKT